MSIKLAGAGLAAVALTAFSQNAGAQTGEQLKYLELLAPVSALCSGNHGVTHEVCGVDQGGAALKANFAITRMIQHGKSKLPELEHFPQQQQRALRDAFITDQNASELADGLGTKLGSTYQAAAQYPAPVGGKKSEPTIPWPTVHAVLAYASGTTFKDAGIAKNFFGNRTIDGSNAASPDLLEIFDKLHGKPDFFGFAYHKPANSTGASKDGNSRPFLTEPSPLLFAGNDYFGAASASRDYLCGPAQNLVDSPSYPSGHTTYGYTESLILALLVPDRYEQMMTRAAEYGNNRIVLSAHYTMDVIGGRTLALYDMAQILKSDAKVVGEQKADFRSALDAARQELTTALQAGCGGTIASCAAPGGDKSRFADAKLNQKFYEATLTYALPVVYRDRENKVEDVRTSAPEAGWLLRAAFPTLNEDEADAILTETEGPGGGFLDDGSKLGVYSRIDLYRAVARAKERLSH